MAKKTAPLLPAGALRLQQFGDRLRLARLRRRLTAKQVAERAGMTTITLRNLERGSSGVTIGAYLAVMQVLGVEQDLDLLVKEDSLGRELQDAALPHQSRKLATVAQRAQNAPVAVPGSARASKPAQVRPAQEPVDWIADSKFVSADALVSLIKQPKLGKSGQGK